MRVLVGKVAGTPNASAWAQVYEFLPLEEEKIQKRGRFVAVLSFKEAPEGIEAVSSGREMLSRLHEEYFGNLEKTPFEGLKDACNKLFAEFPHFGIEIVACVFWQEFVYFVTAGTGEVYLWRDLRLVKLLGGAKDEVSSLSGNPKPSDVFLFGTADVFGNIHPKLLQELLSKNTIPTVLADSLVPLMHKDESASQALAVVGVETEEETEIEEKVTTDNKVNRLAGLIKFKLPQLPVKDIFLKLAAKLPERNIYVQKTEADDGSRRKRVMISAGVILLILLAASIFFGFRQKNILNYRASYEARLVEAETAYSDSLLQKDANPGQARELFVKSQDLVGALVSEGIKDKRIEELSRELEENKVAILGKVEGNAAVLRDLSILRSDITASQIALHKGTLGILDLGGKRVIVSSIDGKETTAIGGPEKLGTPQAVAVYSDRYFVLSDRGIVEFDRKGVAKVAIEPDKEWGEIAGIAAFGGNLYLVDKNGQVWRYQVVEAGGFGTKQEWFGKSVTPDLSKTIDVAIDGSIWLLSSSGKVSKFTRGSPDSFSVSGVSDGIVSPIALYTDENLDNIYILDKSGGKIVEVNKKGEYQKQYVAEDLKQARDFVVAQGKIIVLTENKLLEIGLK